ncbi:hypothetical protein FB567DRAFT_634036 [Paraphoma chrysanthemicola]|uniref:Uncharacterized protein n=1 Tax=Paraphoma chrysanthemicola TaxID=798071 RepID=A0A8K0QU35_9PLEO|nr:hypothetical protein FB567DRAFT_634036 [Paraphoma chrysanthemicola]
MKTAAAVTALMGLLTIVVGTAIPRDDDTTKDTTPLHADAQATTCQTCSKIYEDCLANCGGDDCNNCKQKACNSFVNGYRCGTTCLWYC